MSKLKFLVLLVSALVGLGFAALTIMATIHGAEHMVALAVLAGVVVLSLYAAPDAPKRNAFAGGFVVALIAVLTQAAFLPIYFESNPSYQVTEIPFGLSARSYTILFAPLGALVAGVITAGFTWIATMVFPAVFRRKNNE